MSGTLWLQLKSFKERRRVETFLNALGTQEITFKVARPNQTEPVTCGCFWDTKGFRVITLEYNFTWPNSSVADLVGREIARRFDVRRIGADSVGWYEDKHWLDTTPRCPRERYGPYTTWAAWLKDYRLAWSREAEEENRPFLDLVEAQVVALFKKLDEAA